MNRRYLPLLLMLVAGAVTSIITFVRDFTILQKLIALLSVLVIFYGFGSLIKWMLNTFDAQNQKAALDEGEVIEKDKAGSEEGKDKKDSDKGQEEKKEKNEEKKESKA